VTTTRSGFDRKVDGLGRIVIPAEIRDHFGLHVGDHLDIHIDGDAIVLTPMVERCPLCGCLGVPGSPHHDDVTP
jgi:AbrB family transcriptional regulator, transcriptional pleiotropic regulator of transition state genes